ncbi:MAG: hypothetical protein ACE5GS_16865, partial [Kiloniellaceae bacterium]
ALAACGQLPRPFAPEKKAPNALLRLDDRGGIVVLPVTGDVPGTPGAVAEAMAEALRGLNVPAATGGGNGESRYLHGRALVRPLPGGREELFLYWEVREADGRRTGFHSLRRELPGGAWHALRPELVETLGAAAAPAIAALVQNPPVEMAAIPGFPRARLVVLPLDEGPGDSPLSLPRALEAELLAAKLPVADRIGEDDLLVLGDVALGPPRDGVQEVAVKWLVVSARDDEELGEIAQRDRVPAGSLDGNWGATAREIARGAAAGVIDLLERVARP